MLKLPLFSLLRARSVCKGWDKAIQSKYFMDAYSETCKQEPWLLLFPHIDGNKGLAYDPSIKRWLHISFSFLPFESRVVATSDGLLCMVPKSSHHKQWVVCNPISRTYASFSCPPGLFKLFFLAVGLFFEKDSINDGITSFKVVMAGSELVAEDSEQFNLVTEVYDSSLGYWVKGGNMLLDVPLSSWKATCNGMMFCITGSRPYRVLGYNVKGRVWFEVQAKMPANLILLRLVDHNGVLLMVGGLGDDDVINKIGMWTLNPTFSQWVEFGWMPSGVCHDFLQTQSRQFVCIGHSNFLYFSNKRCHGVLMHNILSKSWFWIPVNPFFINIHYYMLKGFHFQPKLYSILNESQYRE
ncbi:hypothetical protein KP509_22G053900 [Ceratopteris richardii]|nr:hypothetical protein KP509_22G053900 [Ceratopteris richardii]